MPTSVDWPLPPPSRQRHAWLLRSRLRRWRLRRLLRRALPFVPAGAVVVDLGAGTGADAHELLRITAPGTVRAVVLVEAQRSMLAEVPQLPSEVAGGIPITKVLADVARVPVRDGRANVALSIGTICCVAEPRIPDAIRETVRVLAPGGVLVLGVPRWRGAEDEAAFVAAGLRRVAHGRAGRAVFTKPYR